MFVVGIVLWLSSNQQSDLWKWDLIGLLAHLPPLVVNFIFADLYKSSSKSQLQSVLRNRNLIGRTEW